MLMLVNVPAHAYARVKHTEENQFISDIEQAVADGIVLQKMTRSEVHELLFGVQPPEVNSRYCACANAEGQCDECDFKDDPSCDVNWWNSEILADLIIQKMEVPDENTH